MIILKLELLKLKLYKFGKVSSFLNFEKIFLVLFHIYFDANY